MSTIAATNLKNASSGSNNIVLNTDGSVAVTTIQGIIKQGTAVASTSGTAIDFTNIPSWVKRVTVMFAGVSTSGTSNLLVQIGSGSFVTTGYLSTSTAVAAANNTGLTTATTGFHILQTLGTDVTSGHMLITNVTSNTWISSHTLKRGGNASQQGGGDIALSGTLDRIRITTVNGTDTFDAGTINILYEG